MGEKKSQFYVVKEYIPELKSEKEYASYSNMDIVEMFFFFFGYGFYFIFLCFYKKKYKIYENENENYFSSNNFRIRQCKFLLFNQFGIYYQFESTCKNNKTKCLLSILFFYLKKSGVFTKVLSSIEVNLINSNIVHISGKNLEDPLLNLQAVLEKKEWTYNLKRKYSL